MKKLNVSKFVFIGVKTVNQPCISNCYPILNFASSIYGCFRIIYLPFSNYGSKAVLYILNLQRKMTLTFPNTEPSPWFATHWNISFWVTSLIRLGTISFMIKHLNKYQLSYLVPEGMLLGIKHVQHLSIIFDRTNSV